MNPILYYEYGKYRQSLYYNNEFFATGHVLGNVAITLKPDGTTMYLQVHNDYRPNQYALSTPWNISTAIFTKFGNTGYRGQNLYFKPDGTKIYVRGDNNGDPGLYRVKSFTLSTPWDVGTMSLDANTFSPGFTPGGLHVLTFSPDGTKMYIDGTGGNVNQYILSTPWDLTTPVLDYSVVLGNSSCSVIFSPDGFNVYYGTNNRRIYKKSLSIAYDLRTVTSTKFSSIASYVTPYNTEGIYLKPDGTKIFHASYNVSGNIYAFNLKRPFEI